MEIKKKGECFPYYPSGLTPADTYEKGKPTLGYEVDDITWEEFHDREILRLKNEYVKELESSKKNNTSAPPEF